MMPRILLVEDSPATAERVTLTANNAGVLVIAAVATEDEALATCDREPTLHAAVVDLQLAQGTGFGVIRKLRRQQRSPPCMIIVFTNHAVPAIKVASFEAGADYFLDKSRDLAALERLLRELAFNNEARDTA